jgi:hypothetical protein
MAGRNESNQPMTNTALTVTSVPAALATATRHLPPNAHPALKHALKAGALQTNWAACAIGNASATAQVVALGIDPETLAELAELRDAAWQRLSALRTGWMRQWQSWFEYSGQINGANTMSKLAEREANIAAQYAQILGGQITDLVGLQENILVDYSYWIHQKLREKRQAAGVAE